MLICAELDKLLRFITRHQTSMMSSPIPPSGHIPPAFLQCLIELEAGVSSTIASEKAATRKMAPIKAKAVNGMRQTLKRKMKEFEAVLATCIEVLRHLQARSSCRADKGQDPVAYTSTYESANAVPAVARAPKKATFAGVDGEDQADFMTIGKGGKALNLTTEGVFRTLRDIYEQRGRKVSSPSFTRAHLISVRTPIALRPYESCPNSTKYLPRPTRRFASFSPSFPLAWSILRTSSPCHTTRGCRACMNSTG